MKKAAVLTGNRDLLAYYNLLPIYEKYVKPFSSADREGGIDPTLMPYFAKLPGKLDTEYDGYLLKILRDPQAVETGPEIRPLDADSLRRAFSLKEGPIPGFDASIFGSDEADTDDYSGQTVGGLDKDLYELDHNGERKHKKKKKKRKHGHEYEEDGHSDHRKKKKKKNKTVESAVAEDL